MSRVIQEVEIVVDGPTIKSLCEATIKYLYMAEIPQDGRNGDTDTANLLQVLNALIVTKISIARNIHGKHVHFSWQEQTLAHLVQNRFTILPKVINAYLEQIGTYTKDNLTFVPKTATILCFRTHVGERVLTHEDPDFYDSFTDLVEWYEGFISRCSFNAANMLDKVDFGKGIGTAAQLVGCHDDPTTLERQMWCYTNIDQGVLVLGALFGFGLDSRDKFHDRDIAVIFNEMLMAGLYQRIQRCQKF